MVVSTASWTPPKRGRPSATTSRRRASWRATGRSRNTLVQTRVPTSRQIRAAVFSKENPRLPSTPDPRHAARWWPKKSRRRAHRQVREDRGRDKRRRNSTRKRWGQKRNVGEEGTDVNGSPDMGPECDLKRACSVGDNRGQMVLEEKTFFHCPCCAELPTVVERARVKLPKARWARAETISQSLPIGCVVPNTGQHQSTLNNTTKVDSVLWRVSANNTTVSFITGKQSAQLAQFAAWAVRRALRRPPMHRGRLPTSHWDGEGVVQEGN